MNKKTFTKQPNHKTTQPQNNPTTKQMQEQPNRTTKQMQEQIQHIYRYEFNKEFMIELYNFSKIHQYDDRKEFKSAWHIWAEEHTELIEEETRRLVNLNYDGNVNDKMFRSARYYFRKKTPEKKEEVQRRKYTCVDRDIINAMDQHIDKNLSRVKPSDAFLDFCKENLDLLSEEISRLYSESMRADDIKKKIKKTYKNRYFLKVNIS
jgi:outer membrane PBP1 activator LpoA protein